MTSIESTIALKGKIRLIPGRRQGRYPHCNSILVDAGGRAVIDPGSNRHALRAWGEEGVGKVLLSHSHSDHLRDLRELPGAKIWVHASEKAAVESFAGVEPLVYFPEEERDETWRTRKDREVGGWGWPVTGTFADGDEFEIGGVRIVAAHAPGHTLGHCCFWFPDHKLLHTADIDLTSFGPWYGNACSDLADFIASIRRLGSFDPEITVTGHEAGAIEGPIADRLEAYERIIHERHQRILDYLQTPSPLDRIVAQGFIYGDYYSKDNSVHYQEYRMVRHHLNLALARGEARIEDGLIFRGG